MTTLGVRIREARELKGIRQAELARRVGVVAQTAWRWETGRSRPKPADLRRVARELGVELAWLRGDDVPGPAGTGS